MEKIRPEWLTVKDLALELQCSARHVTTLCKKRQIPGARRLGRIWRIHAKTWDRWSESQLEVVPKDEPSVVEFGRGLFPAHGRR